MKIFGMDIPPKSEGAPLEKWYLKAKTEFEEALTSGDPIAQMFALKKFDDISRKADKNRSGHKDDFLKTFNELKTAKPELYTAYTYMQQEIAESLSDVDYKKYDKTGELVRHGKPMLGKDGQPLFSEAKVAEMLKSLDGSDEDGRAKIVQMIYADKGIQNLSAYSKAAVVAGFFAMNGLVQPTKLSAGVLEDVASIEKKSDTTDNSNKQDEFRLVFNAETITKVEGDSLTLLGKKREVLATKTPTQLGLDANTPLKMKTGTKYKLVNAKERLDANGDGKIKVWDGFPGKKIFCLVEIDLNTEGVFKLAEDTDDNLYAAYLDGEELCWNRILPPEEAPDNGQFARTETTKPAKVETRESNLIAKLGLSKRFFLVNDRTNTRQEIAMRVEIETFKLDNYGGNQKIGSPRELYLVKQVENKHTYWKKVDGSEEFKDYYPRDGGLYHIEEAPYTEGYNGLSSGNGEGDDTVAVPKDIIGNELHIYLAEKLLREDVED